MRVVGRFSCALLCITGLLARTGVTRAEELRFTGIGDLDGGGFSSGAFGVSADGSVVVGTSNADEDGSVAVIWTWDSGLLALGRLVADGTPTVARVCSDDGSIVAGESNQRAFRWSKEDGMKDLGTLAPENVGFSSATDLSRDGTVIAGIASTEKGSDAFRWRAGLGMASDGFTGATALSGDGRTFTAIQSLVSGQRAYLVREGVEPLDLGDLPGGLVLTQPTAMTNDAGVVVGYSRSRRIPGGNSSGVNEAFVWRESTGMVGLGNFEQTGFSQSQALGVSEDGRIIVGFGTRAFAQQAAIWIDGGPIQSLKSYLLSLGLQQVEGWTLTSANAISADGRTIVGTGLNPGGQTEGWVVQIPSPGVAGWSLLGVSALVRRRR